MRFLVDANMPRSTLALLATLGPHGEHARDIGLGHAPDSEIAAHARGIGAAVVTRDVDFATSAIIRRTNFRASLFCGCPTMPWRKSSLTNSHAS